MQNLNLREKWITVLQALNKFSINLLKQTLWTGTVATILLNKIQEALIYTQDASVNRAILQHCFFWFSNTGVDAAIATLLPTLKCFSCNGAVDCSTMCFCCESILQKRWQFCDRSAWISKGVRDSSQSCCSISPCHQDLGSKLRGYWFYTKEERW